MLYINVAGLTNVAVANASGCLFTRAAAGGLDAIVHTLAERRGLTLEHARQWMTHVGLHAPLEAIEGDAELVAAARTALEEGVHQLADTVRNSLNFYRMQESAETVEPACSPAPPSRSPASSSGSPSSCGCRSSRPWSPAQDEDADLGRLTVAAGLAVENVVV